MNKIRRSFLFVPTDRPERIPKAAASPADVVVLELEDGVAPDNKAKAREEAGRALAEVDFGHRETALRINRLSTRFGLADLAAMLDWPKKPDILMLPKVESAGEVDLHHELMTSAGCESLLFLLIETSRGLLDAPAIARATRRNTAMCLGPADFSAEVGSGMDWDVMKYHRNALVTACGFGRITAIDSPFLDIKNQPGLEEECLKAREMGFKGKLCIHPSQVEPVNRAFTPSASEIGRAKKIVAAAETQGKGAIVVDGRMVDAPVVQSAKQVVELAERLEI